MAPVPSSQTQTEKKKNMTKTKPETKPNKDKARTSTRTESDNAIVTQQQKKLSPRSSGAQRKKSPVVRLFRGRIYDSQNGISCHQCRQKTRDFVASCKNQSENNQCTINFCHKCLLNRYGEKAEEMAVLDDWMCPRCRGICNCSFCMKKRGHRPTGSLVHTAKANGFSSVSEMLHLEGSDNSDSGKMMKSVGASSKKRKVPNEEAVLAVTRNRREENSVKGQSDSKFEAKPSKMSGIGIETRYGKLKELRMNDCTDNMRKGNKKSDSLAEKGSPKNRQISGETSKEREKRYRRNNGRLIKTFDMKVLKKITRKSVKIENKETEVPSNKRIDKAAAKHKAVRHNCKKTIVEAKSKGSDVDIPLPQGIELNSVGAIGIPAEDVGHALQFLEFCEAFGQVLDLKKGQPEQLLREIACGRSKRHVQNSPIVQFHVRLLSVIKNNLGKEYPSLNQMIQGNSWLQALTKYISESCYPLKELQLDCFDAGSDGYDRLDSSKKLRILNFLCDEALGTADFRSRIDEQNSEREKKAKESILAEKEKEKNMKKKLQSEMAGAIVSQKGARLSISEHEDLVKKINSEVAQALAETLEAKDMVFEKEQQSDAVRTDPIFLDGHGRKFWKLKAYPGQMDILLQDVQRGELVAIQERWYTYEVEQKAMVLKYISSLREL